MNKVLFIGRITKDIELKQIKENGKFVTNFT
jgi:single-strand DNA-binding protein